MKFKLTLNFFSDTMMEQIILEERFALVENALRSTNILMSRKNLCFDIELKIMRLESCKLCEYSIYTRTTFSRVKFQLLSVQYSP